MLRTVQFPFRLMTHCGISTVWFAEIIPFDTRVVLVEMQIELVDERGGLFHGIVDDVLHLLRR
jgi:hypothetical protein